MERVSQRKKISTAKALGLDLEKAEDRAFLRYEKLLLGLRTEMRRQGMSGNQLAKRMGVTRQAIYDRFAGKNTSLEWISRVSECLGMQLKITLVRETAQGRSPHRRAA